MSSILKYEKYLIRRKVFTFFGAKFHVYSPQKELLFFSKLKAFKLKEDIRLYSREDMQEELIAIKARSIIDFSATYDVFDTQTNERVGSLRRKGFKSILQDEWLIFDTDDKEIGIIKEDSMGLAMVRRMLTNLVPQTFTVTMNGTLVGIFKQRFNPFILKLEVDFSGDKNGMFDKRLGIAAGILINAIEGRQG